MKIDVTKINGFEKMTPEEKLEALLNYEEEVDYTGYVKKDTFDKTASELASVKKQLREKMSEEEVNKIKEQEERAELQQKYEELLKKSTVSEHKNKLLALGYDEKLADDTAKAFFDNNFETVFENQKKHMESFEKKIKADLLKQTPKPVGNNPDASVMTLEKLQAMSQEQRAEFYINNKEQYKSLYENGGMNNVT